MKRMEINSKWTRMLCHSLGKYKLMYWLSRITGTYARKMVQSASFKILTGPFSSLYKMPPTKLGTEKWNCLSKANRKFVKQLGTQVLLTPHRPSPSCIQVLSFQKIAPSIMSGSEKHLHIFVFIFYKIINWKWVLVSFSWKGDDRCHCFLIYMMR